MSENKKKLRENKKKIKDNPPVQGKKPLQPVMIYDEEEPKKRTGSIAIPFLVTIFIGLLIVGGIAYFIYGKVKITGKSPSNPKPRSVDISVSPEDSHTTLFIYDDPESGKALTTFVLMRSVPCKKELLLIGIPSNSIIYSEKEKGQVVLREAYERGGAPAAVDFVKQVMQFDFDKYMVLDKNAFSKMCATFGGVEYPVDIDFGHFTGDGSIQKLEADDVIKYLTYTRFSGGEVDRAFKSASLMSEMINGADGSRISENLDRYFAEISSASPMTNISATSYDKYNGAIKYMFSFGIDPELGRSIAFPWKMDGVTSDNYFIPSDNVKENIPDEYFETAEAK